MSVNPTDVAAADYRCQIQALVCLLRDEIKGSTLAIRTLKNERRQAGSRGEWSGGSQLGRLRRQARARFLVIGLLRNRSWEQVENNHPDGDNAIRDELKTTWQRISQNQINPPAALSGVWS